MQAVVSMLDKAANQEVENLWRELENECRLESLYYTPHPHISWQIADTYENNQLTETLTDIARSAVPFTIRCSGVGLFTGSDPVIYILIVKDEMLIQFHRELCQRIRPLASLPNPHYDPEAWVPHITIAHQDVNPDNLDCAMSKLAFRSFDREIRIDNLALLYHTDHEVGQLIARFDFSGV
jgi:2'-5' RNA ligase